MYILGLNIGHNATACLLKDGKILNCVSEERFSRIKNHAGIPFKSISWILKENKISIQDINLIVLDDHYTLHTNPKFGQQFLESYTKKSFKKRIISKFGYNNPNLYRKLLSFKSNKKEKNLPKLRKNLSKILFFPEEKIITIDHHLAHACSTCFNINKNTLIFTLDGEGSGTSASVSIFDGKNLRMLSRTSKHASLGYLYSTTTMFLGMKPLEHEFKVMGLAPYAKEHNISKLYPKFQNLIKLNDNLQFQSRFSMPFNDYYLFREMKFQRFDVIAGCVQKLVEDLVCSWVVKAIKKTGINSIALAGGVFMNVKAVMKISQMPEVKSLFVIPSAGDESNAIGCCFYGYKKFCEKNNMPFSPKPIEDLYLGPDYSDEYILDLIEKNNLKEKYKITKEKNINKKIASLLAKGEIVSRCSGKSEWGARALGNRSILANPSKKENIQIVNELIKDRDFWMPFTPSILDSAEKNYILNPKKIFSPYMAITFDSTTLAQKHLPAAMHPYDFTIRPQVVTKEYNKDYHELISHFKKLTGISGVLNTSFNLHGEPNVLTPEDALHTVENSSLKYLAVNDFLFEKISKSS